MKEKIKIDRTQGFEKGREYLIKIDPDLWKEVRKEIIEGITKKETKNKRGTFRNFLHGNIKDPTIKKIEYIESILQKYNIKPEFFWGKLDKEDE